MISALQTPVLTRIATFDLAQHGDCALLGSDAAGRIAVEELDNDLISHSLYAANGTLLDRRAESDAGEFTPLNLIEFTPPSPVNRASVLNYTAGRWRGLREEERLSDLMQPLTVSEKMVLTRFGIPGPILGIAESYVLAEVPLTPDCSLVCRRVRIAYAIAPCRDSSGLSYDYDTQVLYLAQWFDPNDDCAPFDQPMPSVGVRPMDALVHAGQLIIADGGDSKRYSALHRYEIGVRGSAC